MVNGVLAHKGKKERLKPLLTNRRSVQPGFVAAYPRNSEDMGCSKAIINVLTTNRAPQ
jgi:hypothetical protein